MREYELMVVYDLRVMEAGGADASVTALSGLVENRGGKMLKVDHWGRRRMAYPINRAIDGDYVLARLELDPAAVSALEAQLRIDEQVYRHLIVRADELPVPPPPREPRLPRPEAVAPVEVPAPQLVDEVPPPAAEATASVAEGAPAAAAETAEPEATGGDPEGEPTSDPADAAPA